MLKIIKLTKNDIKTQPLNNNIVIVPSDDFLIIFDRDAAIEFARDVAHLTTACTLTDGDSAGQDKLSTPEGDHIPKVIVPPIGK